MNTDIAITVEYNYANFPSRLCQARTEPATMNILTLLRFQLYSSLGHQHTTDFKIILEEYYFGKNMAQSSQYNILSQIVTCYVFFKESVTAI